MKKPIRFRVADLKLLIITDTLVIFSTGIACWLIDSFTTKQYFSSIRGIIILLIPISIIMTVGNHLVLSFVHKRVHPFLNGICEVTDGNLDVHIDATGSKEYVMICESFNKMVEELRNSRKQLESFTDEFVHEFKTPISSINGFAKYLIDTGEGIETEERMRFLNIIADESLRLSELSKNTLLLSKLESCEIVTDKREFDLTEQIKRCLILLLPKMEKKKIELELYLPEMTYSGNQGMLEQVWINLLDNSVKFTPEYGMIIVRGCELEDGVQITVADNGIGMDEETKKHIFEKYFQHGNVTGVRGNGIGLSIVQKIITLCGGRIDVESEPNEGSRFIVFLPK